VITHLLNALDFGKTLDFRRLITCSAAEPPDKAKWEKLEHAADVGQVDIMTLDNLTGEPQKEMMRELVGSEMVDKEFADKTEEEKALMSMWYHQLKWWQHLKRANFPVKFEEELEPAAKRARK